ncbi:hypothetical protein [Polynucleobacter necessarius]|uniref:hypothetical protein n=1 Tax=Polynucleobacter necessarius TaxID=576610 RepID=UPI000E09341B|nr:hypothetical protein [Polynucleobacter necessarius]
MKAPDKRCCGSGVCIINDAGECWCGQVWDGEKMAAPSLNIGSAAKKIEGIDADTTKTESDNRS